MPPKKLIGRKEAKVLELLMAQGELYGLALVNASEGELSRNTVYVLLNRMEEEGYLVSRHEDDPSVPGMPRRLYRPTGLGQNQFNVWHMVQSPRLAEVQG
jgi:DNA-binding PadR family transcriptional regulator